MAMQSRRNHADLNAALKASPYNFRFFQAVRLMTLIEAAAGRPADLPSHLRFRTPAMQGFVPSEISRFEETAEQTGRSGNEARQEMEIGFLGLTGPSGVLPQHYTELLIERQAVYRDSSAHAFLDIFNHRIISLFYAAWRKYRFYIEYERGARNGFSRYLLDLLASGRPHLKGDSAIEREAQAVPAQALLYFAGILGKRPIPSLSLEAVLENYFNVKIELEQFVGQWIKAGNDEPPILGVNVCLGERAWERQTKIKLHIGPLNYAQFLEFQPNKKATQALRQMVEICLGQSMSCDVTLILDHQDLNQRAEKASGPLPQSLGLTTWIFSRAPQRDLGDVHYKLI